MADEDPRKRGFHCVLTNRMGANGALGIITPDLLEALYETPEKPAKKRHRRHKKHKRKTTAQSSSDDIPAVMDQIEDQTNEGYSEGGY